MTVVWDTWLKPHAIEEGLRLTRKMGSDMRGYQSYLPHQILIDQDDCIHIIALGHRRNREDADRARIRYAESETIHQLAPLLARAR